MWRCAKLPLSRPGRPPLLVTNYSKWLTDVRQIQTDPRGFQVRRAAIWALACLSLYGQAPLTRRIAPWRGAQARTDGRVCIRWDLESSPWRCCPHATGVSYAWHGDGRLVPALLPHANASARLRTRLAAAARLAAISPRESSYDVCQEGAFFHAGLVPRGEARPAPGCMHSTWALQDDIGRFSGSLSLLEDCKVL